MRQRIQEEIRLLYIMTKSYEKICKTLDETRELAEKFAKLIENDGCFINLYGEIGAGKTAFVKEVANVIGVAEKVTSPSFVILNEYHSANIPVYHFDLYRLENEGIKTINDELKEYSEGRQITFVEWAEFSQNQVPFDHIKINVTYEDDDSRKYSFCGYGEKSDKIVEKLSAEF